MFTPKDISINIRPNPNNSELKLSTDSSSFPPSSKNLKNSSDKYKLSFLSILSF